MNQYGQSFVGWGVLEPISPPNTGIHASSEDSTWQNGENDCCVASNDLSSHGNNIDTASSPTRTSRYTNTGLNRPHPLAPYRTPDTRNRNTTKAAEPEGTVSVVMEKYLATLEKEEEEDTAELKKLMVPEEPRSLSQKRRAPSAYGWQPINENKSSMYTVPILTDPRWRAIDSGASVNTPSERIPTAHVSAVLHGDTPDEEGLVIDPSSDPVVGENAEENIEDIADCLWIEGRYFDHYSYLSYTNNARESRDHELVPAPKGKRSVSQSKLKVLDRNGVRLDLDEPPLESQLSKKPLAFSRQPTRIPTNEPTKENTLNMGARTAIHDTVLVHDEVKGKANPESSLDETGNWKLLEGNIDAPRTGNVSPHKLTIKLRNNMTGEDKTFTYPEVEHEDVDWQSKPQITAIIKWRTNVFHEHGLSTKKNIVMYTPLEDAWMTLFHRKLRATVEAGHVVKLPGPATVRDAFNGYLEGKTLKDANGEDVAPRSARDTTSIRGKLDGRASKIAKERKEMRALLDGKEGGAVFVPAITEEELEKLQDDGTVVVDDPIEVGTKVASPGEGGKSRRSSPKRKHEELDAGEGDAQMAKKTSTEAEK